MDGSRAAAPGELCTCGRQAVVVFTGGSFGDTGWCGVSDGGQPGQCAFCGEDRCAHGRCPNYRLTLEGDQ